ncbi:MAG TPA: acyltransferase, partial [Rudaea sp.]|nr:acyltransferase [Rudaea sp.]
MNTTTDQGNRNHSLQVLRGIAAAAVVIYHAAHFTDIRSGGAVRVEQIFGARLGSYGVLVFFVLSGYLMEAAVRRYDPRTFLLHRFVRLYPTFWLLCLVVFLVQSARAGAWITIPWQALTLLPLGEMPRPLGVEWTLLYEVFFYGVCTLLCFWRRAYFGVNVAWLALVAAAVFWHNQYGSTMQPTLAQIPFSGWNVGFI